jgi:AcrR family transcriptional regulator
VSSAGPCSSVFYNPVMSRRADVIAAAVTILRDAGPRELTSVNVAAALGISQPAIYRHIRDMDELTAAASAIVIDELMQLVAAAAEGPDEDWGDGTRIVELSRRIARIIESQGHGFEIMDRYRHDPDELGEGIRNVIGSACRLIATILEDQWRRDLDYHEPFDDATVRTQLIHAHLIADDILTFARIAATTSPALPATTIERMLNLRVYGGWCAYAVDMARRCGLPLPPFDGVCLRVPRLVTA